jgi:hypothetical protein
MAEREHPSEPVSPIALPPELAEFLARQGPYACLTQATDLGTAYVLKALAAEIVRARGTVPVHVQHTLIDHRAAPVIRSVLTIYDQPERPLRFESFINVTDPTQRSDFAALATQDEIILLFYDEALQHRLSKLVPTDHEDMVSAILVQAEQLAAHIPPWRYDFDRAKAAIVRATPL